MIVPQLNYNANALFLWNRNQLDYPINSFIGHKDAILDFGWSNSSALCDNNSYDSYQLVRKTSIDKYTQKYCNVMIPSFYVIEYHQII